MMRINRVATCSSQRSTKHVRRGSGSSKPDGADAREAEQRGFDSSKPDGADAWETEQHGFDSNEANAAGI